MRLILLSALLVPLASCSSDQQVPGNDLPNLATMSETPGDWSDLNLMVGRNPAESGLLVDSPVIVDVDATLGPDAADFRHHMGDSTPLTKEGRLLVTRARSGQAWLVLQPADHAFRAGMRKDGRWRQWQTAGADVPLPPDLPR